MNFNLKTKDLYRYIYLILALICSYWVISGYELFILKSSGEVIPNTSLTLLFKFLNDFWSGLLIGLLLFPIFYLINVLSKKGAFITLNIIITLLVVVQFSLVKYSLTTLINLGADLLGYSMDDILGTVGSSEAISVMYFVPFIAFVLMFYVFKFTLKKCLNQRITLALGVVLILLFGSLKIILPESKSENYQNKIAFLTKDIIKFKIQKSKLNAFNNEDRNDYPLLKSAKYYKNVLTPFFNPNEEKPNIVIIMVEGLGSEFMDGNAYSGFTPYLDSLISKSLYWENFVSTTGRTFGVVPSLLGSLPFGDTGFLELPKTPSHLSLISILKANGYTTSYYSGDQSSFDKKINFLDYNGVENIIDENKFGPGYTKIEANDGGFSWGYPDGEIFRKTLETLDSRKLPRLDLILTLSNHEPFRFPQKEAFETKVDSILNSGQKLNLSKEEILANKDIYASLLYSDTSIKEFINAYEKRSDFDNTIFIITGDHRLIPITQKDKLCRFHVPLYVYSPMLKKAERFKSISSHWDVAPSLLSYLTNNHKFKPIQKLSWFGKGLDTVRQFRNTKSIPLMRYKGSLNDMIYKEYFYADGELFKIKENFGTYKVTEEMLIKTIEDSLMEFKKMNAYVTQRNRIFPDSLNIYVEPRKEFSEEQLVVINKYSKDKSFDELLFIARDRSFNKEYETARLLCDYILNEYPNYTDARILKGRTLAWEGVYEKSEKVLLNALQRSPYYDDVYLAILDMYWWSGQDEKSKHIFAQAMSNEVPNPEISFKMVKAYRRLAKLEQANIVMDSILEKHPDVQEYLTFKATLK